MTTAYLSIREKQKNEETNIGLFVTPMFTTVVIDLCRWRECINMKTKYLRRS